MIHTEAAVGSSDRCFPKTEGNLGLEEQKLDF